MFFFLVLLLLCSMVVKTPLRIYKPIIICLIVHRLKNSEAFSLQLEEERSTHSVQLEKLHLKLKEQKTAHSVRVKKLKEVGRQLLARL